jgi:hypothetical protein
MTTNINIKVVSDGLTDKIKKQQDYARLAQAEKERTVNLSAEALDKRTAAQAAKGLSLDGRPLSNSSFAQPTIERNPAARLATKLAFSVFGIRSSSLGSLTIWPKNGSPTTFNLDPAPTWTPPLSPITGGPWIDTQLFTRNPPGPENMNTLLPEAWEPPIPPGVNRPTFSCYIGSNGNKTSPGSSNYDWVMSDPHYTELFQRTWGLYYTEFSVSTAIVLPIKKDISILVYKYFKVFYKAYYFAQTFRYTGIDKEPLGGDSYVLGQYVEATFTEDYDPGGYEYNTTACFVISKTSVRKIPVPQSLSTLLADWNPFPTTASEPVQALTQFNSPNIGQEGIQQCTNINDPVNNTSYGIVNVTRSKDVTKYTLGPQVNIETARTKKSYGIGALTTTIHTQQSFSPIIYTVLKDPNSKTVVNNSAGNSSYATAAAYSEIVPPGTFINIKKTFNFGASAYTAAFAFEQTTAVPVNDTTAMPEASFVPLSASYNVNYSYPPGDTYAFYVAWDWNNYTYCWQQAVALGFSSSDLRP